MSSVSFTKMHGLGNDFMVIDNLDDSLSLSSSQIRKLADRYTGVGFDQLLVVNKPSVKSAEFDYQIFNADGDEVEHCGNGARCFARFVIERGLSSHKEIRVNTQKGIITLQMQEDGQVTVLMGIPEFSPALIPFEAASQLAYYPLDVGEQTLSVGAVSIGNPHVLLQVEDINTAPLATLGPLMENHPRFPKRVNVGFMQLIDRQHIRLRVFERGVGETRACGTGACAAVAIASRQGILDNTAIVSLPGGKLRIHWPNEKASIEMTGPCSTVFEGQLKM